MQSCCFAQASSSSSLKPFISTLPKPHFSKKTVSSQQQLHKTVSLVIIASISFRVDRRSFSSSPTTRGELSCETHSVSNKTNNQLLLLLLGRRNSFFKMATPGPIPSPSAASKGIDDSLRRIMVRKLDDAIRNTRLSNNKTGADVELTIYNKANNAETYRTLMQKCFFVIANNSQGRRQQPQGEQQQQQLLVNQQQQLHQQGGIVQDQQQQMIPQQQQQQVLLDQASNLLQQQQQQQQGQPSVQPPPTSTMPQQPRPQQQMAAGMQQQQQLRMQQQQHQQQLMMNQQMQQQQGGQMMMRPGMNQGQGVSQLQQRLAGGGGQQMMMRPGMPMNMMAGGQRMPMSGAGGPPNMAMAGMPRGPPPMYMNPGGVPHSMSQGAGGSPAVMTGHSPMNAGYMHSPAGVHSPAGARMVQSPAAMNTPQNPNDPQSAAAQDDQEYLEKVRQLGIYIEPLRKVIARIGNEDQTKLEKMKKLMGVLSNPSKRMPMETLRKCEAVLIKIIDTDAQPAAATTDSSVNPLFEAIVSLRAKGQPPGQMNHVLQKTFGAPLESIYGTEISLPPVPKKKRRVESPSETGDIPDIVQGEIARLRPQFKVNLDPAQPVPKSGMIHLICQLEDSNLPSVPPLTVTLPPGYPFSASPSCETEMTDYFSTPFLSQVQQALDARLGKMPSSFTLSQLLSAWEMAVRAACSPRQQQQLADVSRTGVLMGI